jgi:hypothetical protein
LGGSLIWTSNSATLRSLTVPLTESTVGTYYLGFEVNYGEGDFAAGIDPNNMGYRAIEFLNQDSTYIMGLSYNAYGGPTNNRDPASAQIYLEGFGQNQILDDAPPSFIDDGRTHLAVIKAELSDQAASDSVSLFFDPTTLEEPELASALFIGVDFTLGGLRSGFYAGGGSGQVTLDELRIGTEFADVLPDLPCAGDTDGNCAIDINDFNTILANFGRIDAGGPSEGDIAGANGRLGNDGRVDLRDYRIWRDNRTDTGGGTLAELFGTSVPEPTGGILFLLAMMLAAPRRWR